MDQGALALAQFLGARWPSVRLALLSGPPKRCALLNNLAGEPDKVVERLREMGCLSLREQVARDMDSVAREVEVEAKETVMGEGGVDEESGVPRQEAWSLSAKEQAQEEEEDKEEDFSMPLDEEARQRLIRPEEKVLAGR